MFVEFNLCAGHLLIFVGCNKKALYNLGNILGPVGTKDIVILSIECAGKVYLLKFSGNFQI